MDTTESEGLSKRQLQQTIQYINQHLSETLSLEIISAEIGISQYYFCRLFKQSMGISPYQYIIQQRVERAKQLLSQQQPNIAEVARAVGFANSSHLNRHFKRYVGTTPKRFFKLVLCPITIVFCTIVLSSTPEIG